MTPSEHTSGSALTAFALDQPDRLIVDDMLEAAREFLDMEVAFLARIDDSEQLFAEVSGDAASFALAEGMVVDADWMYCPRMISGELPNAIGDTHEDPITAEMPVTQLAGIRSYIGIPVSFSDGRVYGSMCAISHNPDPSLGKREVRFMRTLARFLSERLEREERDAAARRRQAEQIRDILDNQRLFIVLQPIVDLETAEPVGYEALSRFQVDPPQPPNVWFKMAAEAGLGEQLELAAIRLALDRVDELPEGAYMSINCSPSTALMPEFTRLLDVSGADRLVVEVTEHAAIDDYPLFNSSVARMRFRGLRYAVDDAGAGFSSFSHILSTKPDIVKLDMSLIRDIHRDLSRRALVHGLLYFIEQINATAVAEGVETPEEAEALKRLGVHCAQGYYFGRPSEQVQLLSAQQQQTA